VTEYQITYWRDLPSMVAARDRDDLTKAVLAARFQEAIDEAAMRLGDVGSDAYLAGWRRSDWTPAEGTPTDVADRVVAKLESAWSPEAVADFLTDLAGTRAGAQRTEEITEQTTEQTTEEHR